MCIVSAIHDYGNKTGLPSEWSGESRKIFLELIDLGKKFDIANNEPDCVDPSKEKLLADLLRQGIKDKFKEQIETHKGHLYWMEESIFAEQEMGLYVWSLEYDGEMMSAFDFLLTEFDFKCMNKIFPVFTKKATYALDENPAVKG